MNNVLMTVEKLVPVAITDKEAFFLNEKNQIQPVVDQIIKHYQNLVIDGSTEDGRKELRKVGAEINKVVDFIDGHGKEIVDILKAKPKQIDAGRKSIKDQLAKLRAEIIKPVTDYDEEQKRLKAEEEARIAEEQRKKDEELAQLRAKEAQREREEQIRLEAEEKAKREQEQKLRDAETALQREREDNERKERERLAEIQRQKDEEEKRQLDVNHRREINKKALETFCNFGIAEETAKEIITLIATNKIPHVTINY